MVKPDTRIITSIPDWVLQAASKAGDVAYRWDMHTDELSWWLPDHHLPGDGWPDKGHLLMGRIHPHDLPRRMEALTQHLHQKGVYECEFRLRLPGDDFVWMHDRGQIMADQTGEACLLGLMRPITERKLLEEGNKEALLRDPQTWHLSRRRLREEIERLLMNLRLSGKRGALLTIGFVHEQVLQKSNLNDHALTLLSAALDDCLGVLDCAARLKGGHFAWLMAEADSLSVQRRSGELRNIMRHYASKAKLNEQVMSIHIASLVFPGVSNKPDSILSTAEDALDRAMRLGQSDYTASLSGTGPAFDQARDKAQHLWQARAEGKLYLLHQPIVHAQDRSIIAYESLLRLRNAEGKIESAATFIPDLELLGDMRWLDRYVLDMAVDLLRRNKDLHLSINISGLTVNDPSWARALRLALMTEPQLARRLIIEITETTALSDLEEPERFIRYIRQLGCRVAIDDFGAGFTSFRQLKGLAVDMVKIDGQYIRDVLNNGDHQLFVRHLTGLAKEMNFTTIAEFVESEEQAEFLAKAGIDFLQGYYFGLPEEL